MNQAPNLWHLSSLLLHCEHNQAGIKKGDQIMWVPARAIGFYGWRNRLTLAWMVFRGKADALIWPEGQ
jgi:hypothetical protein